jgi:hypothetical protein
MLRSRNLERESILKYAYAISLYYRLLCDIQFLTNSFNACSLYSNKVLSSQQLYFGTSHPLRRVVKKVAVFWVVAPCGLVEVYRRFRGRCCLLLVSLIMESAKTTETFMNLHQTTRRNSPTDSHLRNNAVKTSNTTALLRVCISDLQSRLTVICGHNFTKTTVPVSCSLRRLLSTSFAYEYSMLQPR